MKAIWNIILRIIAVFAASGLAVIGAGSIAGISVLKAVTVAGLTAVAAVVEKLARAFMDDGKLSEDEINAAFATVDKGAKSEADLKVEARQAVQALEKAAVAALPQVIAAVESKPEDNPDYN